MRMWIIILTLGLPPALCRASALNLGKIVCEPLPQILAERSHELYPELTEGLCIEFSQSTAGLQWRLHWQGLDTMLSSDFHGWKGEVGNSFARDLANIAVQQSNLRPYWKRPWVQTVGIALLLSLQSITLIGKGTWNAQWTQRLGQ